jgi:hypothetical protein
MRVMVDINIIEKNSLHLKSDTRSMLKATFYLFVLKDKMFFMFKWM